MKVLGFDITSQLITCHFWSPYVHNLCINDSNIKDEHMRGCK